MQQTHLSPVAALLTATLWGCTPNFWSLRTGIQGGEISGSVETSMSTADGCDDLTVFAMNNEGTALLTLSMSGPLQRMSDDSTRLDTLLVSAEEDFSLTLQTGQNLYSLPCYDEYYGYYEYYDTYDYEGEDTDEDWGTWREREFAYGSGDIRMSLTARKRRWDYYDDPVHVKLFLQDVTLVDTATDDTVYLSGMLVQTYIYQYRYYWY